MRQLGDGLVIVFEEGVFPFAGQAAQLLPVAVAGDAVANLAVLVQTALPIDAT